MTDTSTGYQRPYNWTNDDAAGVGITPERFDADGDQVAAALNNRLRLDGQGPDVKADIPMAGHSFTGLRPAAAPGEPAIYEQAVTANAFAVAAAILGL